MLKIMSGSNSMAREGLYFGLVIVSCLLALSSSGAAHCQIFGCACNADVRASGTFPTCDRVFGVVFKALGIVCVSIAASALDNTPGLQYLSTSNDNIFTLYKAHIFFLLITVTFMIGTFILLLSCLVSFYTSTGIAKTVYEIIYHSIAFGLYITASITYFIPVLEVHRNHRGNYSHLMAAAIIGLVNSALYLLSTIMARRLYK